MAGRYLQAPGTPFRTTGTTPLNNVFSGPCMLAGFFWTADAGVISIYDGVDTSGTPIFNFSAAVASNGFNVPVECKVGLSAVSTGAGADFTLVAIPKSAYDGDR